jgi:sialic acid synthase SpsE
MNNSLTLILVSLCLYIVYLVFSKKTAKRLNTLNIKAFKIKSYTAAIIPFIVIDILINRRNDVMLHIAFLVGSIVAVLATYYSNKFEK